MGLKSFGAGQPSQVGWKPICLSTEARRRKVDIRLLARTGCSGTQLADSGYGRSHYLGAKYFAKRLTLRWGGTSSHLTFDREYHGLNTAMTDGCLSLFHGLGWLKKRRIKHDLNTRCGRGMNE